MIWTSLIAILLSLSPAVNAGAYGPMTEDAGFFIINNESWPEAIENIFTEHSYLGLGEPVTFISKPLGTL